MGETENQRQLRMDADVLGELGAYIVSVGVPKVEVRLRADLARQVVEAWDRDDVQDDPVATETRDQATVRLKAATLALIGLCGRQDGDHVVVSLDADHVGSAVTAADDDS
jgi:hypothetical protein